MEKRMGRPPKSGAETLGERLEIRITTGEKSAYEEAAECAGMERSDWIRMILNRAAKKAAQQKTGTTGS